MSRRIVSHFIIFEQVGPELHDVELLPPHIDRSVVFGVGRVKRAVIRFLLRHLGGLA